MFNLKKSNLSIGVDISDKIIKAVQLRKSGDRYIVDAISKYKLADGLVEAGEIIDPKGVKEALTKLLTKTLHGSFSGTEVVVCLPDTKTYIKTINVDKTPNKLSSIVAAEIEKNFPLARKDIYYDWEVVFEDASSYQILVGAAPRNIVDGYTAVLDSAGLSIIAYEIESISICRALLEEEGAKFKGEFKNNYCIIDIGAKRTSLTIYSKNTIASSVSLPISGQETTGLISSSLEIDENEAEKAKIVCGLDTEKAHGIVAQILQEMVDNINSKLEQSINFFYKHYPDRGEINQILLCGGGSNIKLLDKTIEEATGIKTVQGNTLTHLHMSDSEIKKIFSEKHSLDTRGIKKAEDDFLTKKQSSAMYYVTAIGLALRSAFIKKI